jgi:hypothetical protein
MVSICTTEPLGSADGDETGRVRSLVASSQSTQPSTLRFLRALIATPFNPVLRLPLTITRELQA